MGRWRGAAQSDSQRGSGVYGLFSGPGLHPQLVGMGRSRFGPETVVLSVSLRPMSPSTSVAMLTFNHPGMKSSHPRARQSSDKKARWRRNCES